MVPSATAAPSAAAIGAAMSISSVLHSAQRWVGLSENPGRASSCDSTTRWRAPSPSSAPSAAASAISERAMVSDTAVTAWQASPSVSAATLSRNAESTPPENATTTRP